MIAFLGPAGSGKSLQGQAIAKKYGWRWLSVGQLLRDKGDPEIQKDQMAGDLVDDKLVTKLMSKAMRKAEANGTEVVLDGYPRSAMQTEWMVEHGDEVMIDGVIVLSVPEKELWKRIKARGRADDTKEVVEKRWEIFEQNVYSILSLFDGKNVKITTVNGNAEVGIVTGRIEEVLRGWGVLTEADIVRSGMAGSDMDKSYGE